MLFAPMNIMMIGKNLGEYHNLYFQFNTLFLADLFENFRKMCPKIYKPDPAHFLTAPD